QASNWVQVGPDCTWVKSRMRTPSSAFPASPQGLLEGLIDGTAASDFARRALRRVDLGAADLAVARTRARAAPVAAGSGRDLGGAWRRAPLLTLFAPPLLFLVFAISISFG